MDNIVFKKIWQDENLIELKISGTSEFVSVYQHCYIEDNDLIEIARKMHNFINDYNKEYYFEFGNKSYNYTPAFSMRILPADITGHIKIETDFEIADNDSHLHRCCFYINSQLGLIDDLGKSIENLIFENVGVEISLNDVK